MTHRPSLVAFSFVTALGCSDAGPPAFTNDAGAGCTASAQCDDNVACTRDLCAVGGVCEHVPDTAMCPSGQTCDTARGCVAPGTSRCTSNADCDDRVACTRDTCLVEGNCRNTAQNEMCPSGETCTARGCSGSATGCTRNEDCDDRIACTDDRCGSDGMCAHVGQNARCSTGQRCLPGSGCVAERACSNDMDCSDGNRCNGVERCSELACMAGTTVTCDDMDACTVDRCVEGSGAMCTHTRDASCMSTGIRSGFYDLAMPVTYRCMAFGIPLANVDVRAFQLVLNGTAVTITGGPTEMRGTLNGMTFSASGTIAGDCNETYSLMGNFIDARTFNATFSAQFAGLSCGLSDCRNQQFVVRGTAR